MSMKIYSLLLALCLPCMLFAAGENAIENPAWAGTPLGMEALGPDYIDPDFAPLEVQGNTVTSGFKKMSFDPYGLPKTISAHMFDILRYPVRLVLEDDRAPVRLKTGDFQLQKVGRNRVVGKAVSEAIGLRFEIESQVDFDFTILYTVSITPVDKPVEIKKFAMVFPVNTEPTEEKLVMYYCEGPDRPESGVEAQKRRLHLTLKGGDYRQIEPGFCSLFWVGTTDFGLSWNFESAKNWNPVKGNEMTYDPGSGNFTVNFIQKATTIDKKLEYHFYLTPTPVKEMPKNWRAWNYGTRGSVTQKIDRTLINQLIYWSSIWRGGGYNPLLIRNPEELRRCAVDDKGMNKANYFIPQLASPINTWEDEDGNVYVMEDKYLDELCKKYQRTNSKVKELDIPEDATYFKSLEERNKVIGGAEDHITRQKFSMDSRTYDVVFAPEIADHMVYALNEFIKLGVGGIYYDGINPQHTYAPWAAWIDPDGDTRPVFHFQHQRDLLKRMRCLVKTADPNEVITAHQSGTRPGSTLSLCDAIIPGETFYYWYHEPEKRDASPDGTFYYAHIVGDIDNLKGEFFYRQWGVPHILLPEIRGKDGKIFKDPRGTRTMLALTQHFDMLYFPTMCQVSEIYKIYRIRNEFGMADSESETVRFVPYWENKLFVCKDRKDKNIKISYYEKTTAGSASRKYMLIVSAVQFNDDQFKVSLPSKLRNPQMLEMQSKQAVEIKDGQFDYSLIAYDFAIFNLTGDWKAEE